MGANEAMGANESAKQTPYCNSSAWLATHALMKARRLDALLFPAQNGNGIAARAGYPSVIVPFGTVPNNAPPAFPAGFEPRPAPFGVTFTGMACSEPKLIALAYAFEQATKKRVAPSQFP